MPTSSQSLVKELNGYNWRFEGASTLEDVLCLSTMTSHGYMSTASDVNEARDKWLELYQGDCYQCPLCKQCLACIINE